MLWRMGSMLSLAWIWIACTSDAVEPIDDQVGFNHFPLEVGDFRVFQIDEVLYNFDGQIDSNQFQIKELVADSVTNSEGGITFTIHRFRRMSDTVSFTLDSVWTARRTPIQGIVVENNIPFVKLIFPVEEDLSWDGNVLNTLDFDEYVMMDVFQEFSPDSLNGTTFSNTITVVQNDFQDQITRNDVRIEVYAKDIGLVYKELEQLSFCIHSSLFNFTKNSSLLDSILVTCDVESRILEF